MDFDEEVAFHAGRKLHDLARSEDKRPFFLLVSFAAITSAISIIEPAVAWFVEKAEVSRATGAVVVGILAWFVGLGSAFSFNIMADMTFLPGVITFNLFGHEVELLPRALIVNKKDIPWSSAANVVLRPEAKPATPPKPPRGGTREAAP